MLLGRVNQGDVYNDCIHRDKRINGQLTEIIGRGEKENGAIFCLICGKSN